MTRRHSGYGNNGAFRGDPAKNPERVAPKNADGLIALRSGQAGYVRASGFYAEQGWHSNKKRIFLTRIKPDSPQCNIGLERRQIRTRTDHSQPASGKNQAPLPHMQKE